MKKRAKKSTKKSSTKRKLTKVKKKAKKKTRAKAQPQVIILRGGHMVREKRPGLGRGMAEGAAAGFGIAAGHEFGEWVFD